MTHSTTVAHALKLRLQDGTPLNLARRIKQHRSTFVALLQGTLTDPRSIFGKRHSLELILLIILVGLLAGCKDLKDCCLYAQANVRSFRKLLDSPLKHGIPDPTTVSRVMQKLNLEELVTAVIQFLSILGIHLDDVYSFDGKTMRAVTGENAIRHILSLFTHNHIAIGQIGVTGKENEIPALERLLQQGQSLKTITGKLLIGDALHTQKATCKAILKAGADYLFVVKGNQRKLRRMIQGTVVARQQTTASDAGSDRNVKVYTYTETKRKRQITTTVTAVTAHEGEDLLPGLKGTNYWAGVQTIGILQRTGTRTGKDGTVHEINETIGFISSRILTAEEVATHLRNHWCIENNLHWVKDEVFREDKHSLRLGHAPQVMSLLRSLVISLCNGLQLRSISDCIHRLQKSPPLMWRFLRYAAVA